MNGYECDDCDMDPCICGETYRKERIKEGKEVLEVSWDVFTKGPKGWKRKLIKWLWPDLSRMANAIMEYYWSQ